MFCLSEPPVTPNLGNQQSGFTLVGFLWLTKSSLNILVKSRKNLQAHRMASMLYPDWGQDQRVTCLMSSSLEAELQMRIWYLRWAEQENKAGGAGLNCLSSQGPRACQICKRGS